VISSLPWGQLSQQQLPFRSSGGGGGGSGSSKGVGDGGDSMIVLVGIRVVEDGS